MKKSPAENNFGLKYYAPRIFDLLKKIKWSMYNDARILTRENPGFSENGAA